MTRLLLLFTLLTSSLLANVAVHLQDSYIEGAATGTSTIVAPALPYNVTAGHELVIFAWFSSSVSVTSIVTSGGDTCSAVSGSIATGTVFTQVVYACFGVAGGASYIVTANMSGTGSVYNSIYVAEYAGLQSVDVSLSSHAGSGAGTIALGSTLTPTAANELVFAAAITYGSGGRVYTPSGNFRPRFPGAASVSFSGSVTGIADQVQSTVTAVQNAFTTNQSGEWALSVVTFRTADWISATPYIINSQGYIQGSPQTIHTSAAFDTTGATHLVLFIGSQYQWPVTGGSAVAISSVIDRAGNVWTRLAGPTNFAGATFPMTGAVYSVTSPIFSSSDTITITLSNAAPLVMHCYVVAGSTGTSIISAINQPASGTTANLVSSGPIIVPNNSLLLQWVKNENPLSGGAISATGFSIDWGQTEAALWASSRPVVVAGSYSGNYTLPVANGWQSVIVGLGHDPPAPWSGVIDPSRAIDWSIAGVTGGIPSGSWTQCGATIAPIGTIGTPVAPTAINAAIAACGTGTAGGANTYVQLGAGTFYLTAGLRVQAQSNVEIRGMGADKTFLVFSGSDSCDGLYAGVCFDSADVSFAGSISNGPVSWTASSYAAGQTTITLSGIPSGAPEGFQQRLLVGMPINLDQLDSTTDIGSVLEASQTRGGNPFTSPGSPGPYSLQDDVSGAHRVGRGEMQIVTVTGCNGVTTVGSPCTGTNVVVTISPGLHMPNWSAAQSPQAWWASYPAINVGVQNLSLDMTNAGFGPGIGAAVGFVNTLNGWARGIRTIATARTAVQANSAAHITVRDSYFYLALGATSTSYGTECFGSSDILIENNIYQAIAGPLIMNGSCLGVVMGYNYAIMQYYQDTVGGWAAPMSNAHGVGADMDLWEGNIGSQISGDVFHGSHNMGTLFRNRLAGTFPACWLGPFGGTFAGSTYGPCLYNLVAIDLLAFTRYFNIVGNVLGTPGVQNGYQSGTLPVVALGGGDNTVPADPATKATAMLWGNWDAATNAVRWCGNSSDPGWSTTCSSTSEVPTTDAFYPNPVPASTSLPASFYLTSKPGWWPVNKPWPLIGPDVTEGNIPGVGGYANTNPAQDCYSNVMNGPSGGTGSVLSFNAAACYGTSSSTALAPPTNLRVTVH